MDWKFMIEAPPTQTTLLSGCSFEAERADRVFSGLEHLRKVLEKSYHGHLVAVAGEVRRSGELLRQLAGQSQIYPQRVPATAHYLNVILPCLSKSLRDITAHYENKTISREMRWRTMYHQMAKEAGDVTLPQRFLMYNHFMTMLLFMLVRDKRFDPNQLDQLNNRIISMRELRGIPAPAPLPSPMTWPETSMAVMAQPRKPHWAEQIFSVTLPTKTRLPKARYTSQLDSPMLSAGHPALPEFSRILMQRSFDSQRLRLMVCLGSENDSAYLLFRMHKDGQTEPWFAVRGVHEICVRREGSLLILKRWSRKQNKSVMWAVLSFSVWEELILYQCTFAALKARDCMTLQMDTTTYKSTAEKRLFQAQILDDGYVHCLIVYEDISTKGLRLHATVWDGELRECPVWTAFITHQSRSPTWLSLKEKKKVLLQDVHVYVFCQKYRAENMRRGKGRSFELVFREEEAAKCFRELFVPGGGMTSTESSDADVAVAGPSGT